MAVKKTKKTNFSIVEQTPEIKAWWKVTRKYEVLTPAREKYLFDEIASAEKTHDSVRKDKAVTEIVMSNRRLIYSVATTFTQDPYKIFDYFSRGEDGVMIAIGKFDPTKNIRFMTFASDYVYREMFEFNSDYGQIVRRSNDKKIGYRIKAIRDEFYTKSPEHRDPTNEEIKDILKERYDIDVADDIDLLDVNVSSLDMPASEEGDDSTSDVGEVAVRTASKNAYLDEEEMEYTEHLVNGLLLKLDEREREIVTMAYGIHRDYPMDPDDIADHFGLTRTRVNQILAASIKKMRGIAFNN